MSKTDDAIAQALSAEDRELLARHAEPGYLDQAFGIFRGALAPAVWVAYVSGLAAFLGFGYALWQCWVAVEMLAAVKWGMLAIVLFQFSAMLKAFLGSHLEANRMLREIKRVELRVAMLGAAVPHNPA